MVRWLYLLDALKWPFERRENLFLITKVVPNAVPHSKKGKADSHNVVRYEYGNNVPSSKRFYSHYSLNNK